MTMEEVKDLGNGYSYKNHVSPNASCVMMVMIGVGNLSNGWSYVLGLYSTSLLVCSSLVWVNSYKSISNYLRSTICIEILNTYVNLVEMHYFHDL